MSKIKTVLSLLLLTITSSQAASLVNFGNVPIQTAGSGTVKPNIMFILDNSGSMLLDTMGDNVIAQTNCKGFASSAINQFTRNCVANSSANNETNANDPVFSPRAGSGFAPDAPLMAYQFNTLYYNPNIVYSPPIKSDLTMWSNQSLTSAQENAFSTGNVTFNMTTDVYETYFCTKNNPTTSEKSDTSVCRRNGINTPNPFNYYTQAYPDNTYRFPVQGSWTPAYFTITGTDYCDASGVNCGSTSTSGSLFAIRYCKEAADAQSATIPTGKFLSGTNIGKNICQRSYDSGYTYPRYGQFERFNIGASEATNFANWYSFYRSRMMAMKSAAGLAFKELDDTKRVGFITISNLMSGSGASATVKNAMFLPMSDFNDTQKINFLTKFYAQQPSGGTPLREALSRVGRYYAGKTDGISNGMIISGSTTHTDPVQYSCQQNYTILSTDGYWNGNAGVKLNSSAMTNQDNVDNTSSPRALGIYDGGLTGSASSLADVSLYYYNTDLRPAGTLGAGGIDVSIDNVPTSIVDTNTQQHMVTYAISLGLSGFVQYTSDYYRGTSTDLENIKQGTVGACSWTTSTAACNWPVTNSGGPALLDDLWHSTISGRGRYYNAQNSLDIVRGIQDSLSSIISQTASASTATTSNALLTTTSNKLYSTTYRTGKWDGEVVSRDISLTNGAISTTNNWSARALLQNKSASASDTRTIKFIRNGVGTSSLVNFEYDLMNTTEKSYFDTQASKLTQYIDLTASQRTLANTGTNLINYLRGQYQYEFNANPTNPLFRTRDYILGDIVDSGAHYVGAPVYNFSDVGYSSYKLAQSARTGMVYTAANDGMLHAFNASTGVEQWAIYPSQLLSSLYKLSDSNYTNNHTFLFNGQVQSMDVYDGSAWKTIIIAGTAQGGNGYIAIDVTDPTNPIPLWELCKSSSICSRSDADLGYTTGNIIITKRAFDSKWVAYFNNGYDSETGLGIIYEVDVLNGEILRKLTTGTGSAASPAQLGKINTYYADFNTNNTALFLYAGDLDGNIWKWELNSSASTTAIKLGVAQDSLGNLQPITSRIELGILNGTRLLFIGTGRYLTISDVTTAGTQTMYALKDNDTVNGILRNNSGMIQQSLTTSDSSSTITSNAVNWSSNIGWYIDLTSQVGERINLDPILAAGTLNFIGNVPGNAVCTVGGASWYYQIGFSTGTAATTNAGVAAQKTSGGFTVGQTIVKLGPGGQIKNLVSDANANVSPYTLGSSSLSNSLSRSAWREILKKN